MEVESQKEAPQSATRTSSWTSCVGTVFPTYVSNGRYVDQSSGKEGKRLKEALDHKVLALQQNICDDISSTARVVQN